MSSRRHASKTTITSVTCRTYQLDRSVEISPSDKTVVLIVFVESRAHLSSGKAFISAILAVQANVRYSIHADLVVNVPLNNEVADLLG